jgi:hypothetical protein
MCQAAMDLASAVSNGPQPAIFFPWTHESSVPDASTPSNRTGCPDALTSRFPTTRRRGTVEPAAGEVADTTAPLPAASAELAELINIPRAAVTTARTNSLFIDLTRVILTILSMAADQRVDSPRRTALQALPKAALAASVHSNYFISKPGHLI